MTSAVIFVPSENFELFASQCLAYCAGRGYDVVGLVKGEWRQALAVLKSETAGVIVVARADHLDPDRQPRIDIVSEHQAVSAPTGERTRMVRRNAAR